MKKKVMAGFFVVCTLGLAILIGYKYFSGTIVLPFSSKDDIRDDRFASPPPSAEPFERRLFNSFSDLEVLKGDIEDQLYPETNTREITVRVPRGLPVEWIVWKLTEATEKTEYQVEDAHFSSSKRQTVITFSPRKKDEPQATVIVRRADHWFSKSGKMAIVIRGFSFKADKTTTDILSFKHPLTISLQPVPEKSTLSAQIAGEYKKETIIRLSLESKRGSPPDKDVPHIMIHYSDERIRELISTAAGTIPNFTGFTNRGGSRACEDSRLMTIVLKEIERRHGYFLENPTTPKSVAATIAKKTNTPYGEIDAYIEDGLEPSRIEKLLRHYCVVAQRKGEIIVSAPAEQAVLDALLSGVEIFRQNGIRLAYVSELVE
jgi:polysaccharide deacetylase 2 family uncharacterized protein YibQ